MRKGSCTKVTCNFYGLLTRHHVLPKRFRKPVKGDPITLLCRSCHDEIEKLIPLNKQMSDFWYMNLVSEFTQGLFDTKSYKNPIRKEVRDGRGYDEWNDTRRKAKTERKYKWNKKRGVSIYIQGLLLQRR